MRTHQFNLITCYLVLALILGNIGQAQAIDLKLSEQQAVMSTNPTIQRPMPRESSSSNVADTTAGTQAVSPQVTGDLSVDHYLYPLNEPIAGRPISYTVFYSWSGDEPAPNAQLVSTLPNGLTNISTSKPPTSQAGNTLTWNLGSLSKTTYATLIVTGTIDPAVTAGTELTSTMTISADVTDNNPANNVSVHKTKVVPASPELWLWKFGLFEEAENGGGFVAEQDSETRFEIFYVNFSAFPATTTVLIDQLPEGVTFISAEPAPSTVSGQELRWNLGTLGFYDYGTIKIRVKVPQVGSFENVATINSAAGDRQPSNNTAKFQFQVVPLLPPRLLKPSSRSRDKEEPVILAKPRFEGLSKPGATVTLYQGSEEGCFGTFENCNPVAISSVVADMGGRWVLTPTLEADRVYPLYLRARVGDKTDQPSFNFWDPLFFKVDPRFEQAGFDIDNFVIRNGARETRPGGLGGSSGTTPHQSLTIKMRQKAPDSILTNLEFQAHHTLKLVVTEGAETFTETLAVSQIQRVTTQTAQEQPATPDEHFSSWDFIYVHKGFGPGSKVEIWCLPVFYTEDGIPIVGLVYVKCHEILIDPAGYVYDLNKAGTTYEWPAIPPSETLLANATVTVTTKIGEEWVRWNAEASGQVNPQVTDTETADRIIVPGYYAFYVPAGQYQVIATAPGCVDYVSPILTVVDAPIFHNVGMRCDRSASVGAIYEALLPLVTRP